MKLTNPFRKAQVEPRYTLQQAAELIAFSNPALASALQGERGFSFADGVKELDQDFDHYLKSVGLFEWVSACIDAIGTAATSVPLVVVEDDGDPILNPPEQLARLISRPNPDQGYAEFWRSVLQQIGYCGEGPIVGVLPDGSERISERTEEFWSLRADQLAPKYSRSRGRVGRETPELLGWIYAQSALSGERTFPADAVLLPKRPHPRDPIRGLSPMKELETTLNWMWAALQSNKSYLANGSFPGLVLTSERAPETAQQKSFEDKFLSRHQGAANLGRALWFWGLGMKVDRMRDAPKDALQMEVLSYGRQAILAVYKVPPFVLGILEHANWSNSNEQQRYFFRHAVMPVNQLVVDALNNSALVPRGMRLQHDYSGIEALQPNRKEQADRLVVLKREGIITANEARVELGKEALEGGDELRATQTSPVIPQLSAEFGDRGQRYLQFLAKLEPLERRMAQEWRKRMRELRGEVLEGLAQAVAILGVRFQGPDDPVPSDLGDLFDVDELTRRWIEEAFPTARQMAARGAADTIGETVFPVDDPRITAYLDRVTASRIRTIAHNRLNEVRDVVRSATQDQATVAELQTRIREHFDTNSIPWASRIARTETAGLYNRGALIGMEELGATTKQWLSSRDASVRPSHVKMDGTEIPIGEDFVFPESGGSGPAPGDIDVAEDNIGCRCVLVAGEMP